MQTVIGWLTQRLQKLCMQCSISGDCISLNELLLYIQPQLCTCTHTNMDVYLIKLRVESLFYDWCFVLGFLVNVWLEVPETEECDGITLSFTGHNAAERNRNTLMVTANTNDDYIKVRVSSFIWTIITICSLRNYCQWWIDFPLCHSFTSFLATSSLKDDSEKYFIFLA